MGGSPYPSICVAVMTYFPCSSAIFIIFFCNTGTSSKGISTPISPLATIMPSDTDSISSKFWIAAGMYPVEAVKTMAKIAERSEKDIDYTSRMKILNSRISSLHLAKEAAIKSYPISQPKIISSLSVSLMKKRIGTVASDVTAAISHATCTTASDLNAAAMRFSDYCFETSYQSQPHSFIPEQKSFSAFLFVSPF